MQIKIPRWFDRHLHPRDHEMMTMILPCTLKQRATGAVIMGNLKYPDQTSSIAKALAYRKRILATLPEGSDFKPRMTLYLTDEIGKYEVVQGFHENFWCAVKLYMADQNGQGGTTGSQNGVKNLLGRYDILEAMQEFNIPLLGHWEAVEEGVDEFDREIVSVERDLVPILKRFPKLPVVFEHLTDGRAADFVATSGYENIYATVTAHHLRLNRNAMFQGGMAPINYCKPVPKREEHRLRVRHYVTSGHRRFGAGTDSAPHDEEAKSRYCRCAAGIFTAPIAVELYATTFYEDDALKHFGPFMSENFLHIYGMEPSDEMMTLGDQPMTIPEKVGNVRVFCGGQQLPFTLA